jgi:hypothetical protein
MIFHSEMNGNCELTTISVSVVTDNRVQIPILPFHWIGIWIVFKIFQFCKRCEFLCLFWREYSRLYGVLPGRDIAYLWNEFSAIGFIFQ